MKTYFTNCARLICLLCFISISKPAHAQASLCDTCASGKRKLLSIYRENGAVRRETPAKERAHPFLVSARTFNEFAAQKQAYYLSGSSDLSLYENFAISSVTDGTLQLGHNFAHKAEDKRVDWLGTIALQSNIKNNFANLLAKGDFSNDVGVHLKATYLFANKIKFDSTQRAALERKREYRFRQLDATIAENKRICNAFRVDATLASDPVADSAKVNYCQEQSKKDVDDFYAFELKSLEKHGTYYNTFRTWWVSGQVFIPLTAHEYIVATDSTAPFVTHDAYNWSIALNIGRVREYTWGGTFFFNPRYRLYNNNVVDGKSSSITKYNQYAFTHNTSRYYLSDDAKTVYVGPYSSYYTSAVQVQGILLFPFGGKSDNKFGISGLADANFGTYDALNLTLGFPVFLKGKSKEKGVNVEPQLKWVDVRDTVAPQKSRSDKFTIGLSISLPFGSALY